MNLNELNEIYRAIIEYGQTMSKKVEFLKSVIGEKNEIKTKIRNLTENNCIVNVSQIEDLSQISGNNDFSQFDHEMDLSSH